MLPTEKAVNTGRVASMQELSLPLDLGPAKVVPYGVLGLSHYTEDLTGNQKGRAYGGGGVRGSVPLSRLYADASSELFNVRGLYHKITVSGNYLYARSDEPYTNLPQLDRLFDDVTDLSYRSIVPYQQWYVPGAAGVALERPAYPNRTDPQGLYFDPQQYAIRRLVDNRLDTLDNMQVVQAGVRQRLQTKRGYEGFEHVTDVLTLDVTTSFFPQADRDNYGESYAFLEYNALWNVGDRTALKASGWFDPFEFGTRYYSFGAFLGRPDATNFYVGYSQIDPIGSKMVTASVAYRLSQRYGVTASTFYDFGVRKVNDYYFGLNRFGSDTTVSLGLTYNALINNFGFQFSVVPNLISYFAPGRTGTFGSNQ